MVLPVYLPPSTPYLRLLKDLARFGQNTRKTCKVVAVLAVLRKRCFLDIGRERLAGLVQLEADAVECGPELLLG